ncbi:MAG: phosphatidate cytidylyltransferase [Fibrobacter sp.]|nr:phosphatidate cytidylyltransferase [Fibrobacter sp.]
MSNLTKRLIFAIWAIPMGWWVINCGSFSIPGISVSIYPGQIVVMALILISNYEYTRMLAISYKPNLFWLSYLWLAMQFYGFFDKNLAMPSNMSFFVLFFLVALEAFVCGRKNKQKRWVRASLLFSGTAFLSVAAISLLNFYSEPFQHLFRSYSHQMLSQIGIVLIFTSIFMCDSAAYFVGSAWGKTHFSSISPKKTVEGSIGGLTASVLVCSIGWYFFASPGYARWLGIVLGILIGVFAQIGDLVVSLMKRNFCVKDSSGLIPGHGGILDRFDSVFFSAPIVSIFLWVISKIMVN